MSKNIEDKDDSMVITVEKGEEVISFRTNPDLHISEFRDLLMRLAAAVGYHQSNIEEYFIGEPEGRADGQLAAANEATAQNFESPLLKKVMLTTKGKDVDMGGNYTRDDTFV